MGRQNKPTIRGSSILIDFILQNATQLKVEKLAPLPQKKSQGKEVLICSFFHSSKLFLTSFLQCKYCRLVLHTVKQQNNNNDDKKHHQKGFQTKLLLNFQNYTKILSLRFCLEGLFRRLSNGTISPLLKKKKVPRKVIKFPTEPHKPYTTCFCLHSLTADFTPHH